MFGNAVPAVSDTHPIRRGDPREEIAEHLLNPAEAAGHIENVLMHREFDSQHILAMLSQRELSHLVPRRM